MGPELLNTLISYHNKHGHSVDRWFDWLLDDCLAACGRRISESRLPPSECREGLFELSKAYGKAAAERGPFEDVLGPIYMELASQYGKKRLGQYFTPVAVARMMSQINLLNGVPSEGLIKCCDPASGAGIMLLTTAEWFYLNQPEALSRLSLTGIDLDSICARMTALQIMAAIVIHQIQLGEVLVYHGNSLGGPEKLSVIVHAVGQSVESPVLPALSTRKIEAIQEVQKTVLTCEDQIALF